jgi:hypothetical protein
MEWPVVRLACESEVRQARIIRNPAARLFDIEPPEKADLDRRGLAIFDRKLIERKRKAIELTKARNHPIRRFVGQDQDATEIHSGSGRERR